MNLLIKKKLKKEHSVLNSAFDLWILDIVQKSSGNWAHVASIMQKQHAYAVVINLVLKSKWISHRELQNLVWSHKIKNGSGEVCVIYVVSCFLQTTQFCNFLWWIYM